MLGDKEIIRKHNIQTYCSCGHKLEYGLCPVSDGNEIEHRTGNCTICGQPLLTREDYRAAEQHVCIHRPKPKYPCWHCGQRPAMKDNSPMWSRSGLCYVCRPLKLSRKLVP